MKLNSKLIFLFSMAALLGAEPEIIFFDNAEGAQLGKAPVPQVGRYTVVQTQVVESGGAGPDSMNLAYPSSPDGSRGLLIIDRPRSDLGRRNIADFSAPILDGWVSMDAEMYHRDGVIQFGLGSDEGGNLLNGQRITLGVSLLADGGISAYGSNQRIEGVFHQSGKWLRYRIDYQLGADHFMLTVGDQTVPVPSPWADGTHSLKRMDRLFVVAGSPGAVGYVNTLKVTHQIEGFRAVASVFPGLRLLDVQVIADEAPHSAFTDLIRFNDQWVCAFREGQAHAGSDFDSRMRVIGSTDRKHWQSLAALTDPRGDIRDAKMAVMPDGRLMLLTAVRFQAGEQTHFQSIVWFTDDLEEWQGPYDVGEPNVWLWGIQWHNGVGYSLGYSTDRRDRFARLYRTEECLNFSPIVDRLPVQANYPNESAIVFDSHDRAWMLLRCDPEPAYVGWADPPYTDWNMSRLDKRIGGPAMTYLPGGKLFAVVRLYREGSSMAQGWETWVCRIDVAEGRVIPALQLPSGGDTSYGGIVRVDNEFHISYYSSHEGRSKIYMARLDWSERPGGRAFSSIAPTVPRDQGIAEILVEAVIAHQPDRYIGWPTVVRAANGDLVAVFSGDRDWHVCPWGRVFLTRSTDAGDTWSAAVAITNTPLDDRDAGLLVLLDGRLMMTFFTSVAFDNPNVERYGPYQRHALKLTPEIRQQWLGNWSRVSEDHGHTWGPYQRMPVNTPHGPTVLEDGRLIIVRQTVHESHDAGASWQQIAAIERDPQTWNSRNAFLSEQHAVETADGRIVALSRYRDGDDIDLRQMESADGGLTWTTPKATGMRGFPAHLLRLENDWLLAVYGRRIAPMGIRATISKDHGRTWLVEDEVILSHAIPQDTGHLGYPASAQLPDGSIWTVFYQVTKPEHGENSSLMGTHWRLR